VEEPSRLHVKGQIRTLPEIDYAQAMKLYASVDAGAGRYSPPRVSESESGACAALRTRQFFESTSDLASDTSDGGGNYGSYVDMDGIVD
jgi:hypothetical protein